MKQEQNTVCGEVVKEIQMSITTTQVAAVAVIS